MTIHNKATTRLLDDTHNPGEIARRRRLIDEAPVRRLNAYARTIRANHENDLTVPWFDPLGGGERARVLLLLQDPSRVAATGSGFISPDNNDPTARNTTIACREAGLSGENRVHWNIYPWWVNDKGQDVTRPRETYSEAMRRAVPFINELIGQLLPSVTVVVLMGKQSSAGWQRYVDSGGVVPRRINDVLRCPHPSGRVWPRKNQETGRPNGEEIIRTLRRAGRLASAK
jgi:hypothetical protein